MAAHRRTAGGGGITGVLSWRLRKKGQLAATPAPHEAFRDGQARPRKRAIAQSLKLTLAIALCIGTALAPIPASTIGFGGGGPLAPSTPPQLFSPFGSEQPHSGEAQQPAAESVYLCVCDRTYCGNNAISGRYGQIKKDIPANDLPKKYGPMRVGDAATGWICLEQGAYRCECAVDACGNDAAEAARGTVLDDVTAERVTAEYRPWRTGDQATGWRCEHNPTRLE